MKQDAIVIGAGLYGLYSALRLGKSGEKSVTVLEMDPAPFMRATYVNQARVHMGYHYPRSLATAVKSAGYFERFCSDYDFCIHRDFKKVYAVSDTFSLTDREAFLDFCRAAGIYCEEISPDTYFQKGTTGGAFLTREYTYDAQVLGKYLLDEIARHPNIRIVTNSPVISIEKTAGGFVVRTATKEEYFAETLVNTAYASVNQILHMLGREEYRIKYELCEIILCKAEDALKDIGITMMDGPFFSIMPFGKTGYHSLTAVAFTPHQTCHEKLPKFDCMEKSGGYCCSLKLGNCNTCEHRPDSAFPYMNQLARKYLLPQYSYSYEKSLFSMKPILEASELDDSRPTVIRVEEGGGKLISVLSGKINTVYDLDAVLV